MSFFKKTRLFLCADVSPTALLTMGEDDHPTVVFSDGSVCRSQDNGVPPLPPAEWEDRNKVVDRGEEICSS